MSTQYYAHTWRLLQRSCQIHMCCILLYGGSNHNVWQSNERREWQKDEVAKSAPKSIDPSSLCICPTHNFNIASALKSRACYREYRSSTRQQMTCVTRGDNFNYTIRQIQLPSNHFRLIHYIPIAICPPGHLNLNLYPSHALSLRISSPECLFIARYQRIVK